MHRLVPTAVLVVVTACVGLDAERLAPRYVGRAVCAGCHTAQAAAYAGSDHDRAMDVATDTSVLGDFDGATFEHAGTVSTFQREGDDYYVRTEGESGELETYRVAYTLGVRPLQQYLVEFADGRIQRLALSWDSRPAADGGQRWFHVNGDERIEPGDPLRWTGVFQRWNTMCAECHTTDLRRNYDAAAGTYATAWSEIDVSCEACHGPGSRHVAWAESAADGRAAGNAGATVDVGLVAGASAREMRLQACARCHSYRVQLRQGAAHVAPLGDTHALRLLDEGLYFADGQVREEVFVWGSFLQSRMYRAGVTCTDCHDPHTATLRRDGDALCAQCHDAGRFAAREHTLHTQGSTGARCVACHMPERTFMVVDGRRDHSFRVPRPDVSARIGAPDVCTSCHTDRSQAWAAGALAQRAGSRVGSAHFGELLAAARRGDPSTRSDLARLMEDTAAAPIVRATAVSLLASLAGEAERASVVRATSDADAHVRAAAARTLGRWPWSDARVAALVALLDDAVLEVRLAAARALATVPLEPLPPGVRTRIAEGIAAWIEAQRVNADHPAALTELARLHVDRGDIVQAERAFRAALAIEPRLLGTRIALAELVGSVGRTAEAVRILRDAIEDDPERAAPHFALGLMLVRNGERDAGLAELVAANRLDPDDATVAWTLAIARNEMHGPAPALAVLEAALERNPWDPRLLLTVVTIERDRGDLDRARAHAARFLEAWPDRIDAQRLMQQLDTR